MWSGSPEEQIWQITREQITKNVHYQICSPGDLLHIAPPRLEVEQAAMTTSHVRQSAA